MVQIHSLESVFNAAESAYWTTCKPQALFSQSQNVQTFILNNPKEGHNPATTGMRTEKDESQAQVFTTADWAALSTSSLSSARLVHAGARQGYEHRADDRDYGAAVSGTKHKTYNWTVENCICATGVARAKL